MQTVTFRLSSALSEPGLSAVLNRFLPDIDKISFRVIFKIRKLNRPELEGINPGRGLKTFRC